MLGIQRGWQRQFDHAALDQRFQFGGCLLMILDHLLRERLGVRVCLLGERHLARLNLKHITDRDLVHEVLSRWRAGPCRLTLGKSNGGEQSASDGEDQSTLHGGTPRVWRLERRSTNQSVGAFLVPHMSVMAARMERT